MVTQRCRRGLAALLLAACTGCATTPGPAQRMALGQALAARAGWAMTRLPTTLPMMAALAPDAARADVLTVYVEGDGFAWRTAEWPSVDPTPTDPVALRLAVQHRPGPAVWLARPCQYVDAQASACPSKYWTSQRYAASTTALIGEALDILKARYGATHLALVGYSGGGAVAAIVASQRSDVTRLITVAANLDLEQWTRHHGLPPMNGSDNPAALGATLRHIPQVHFVGGLDKVVPPATVKSYAARLGSASAVQVIEVAQADHGCCWSQQWPGLLSVLP